LNQSAAYLSAAEAARRLGVSAKALRLYEQRGLLRPARSAAGWRAYGPAEMGRAAEIAALRALGLSLAGAARVLDGNGRGLEPALAAHQALLEAQLGRLGQTIAEVAALRARLGDGHAVKADALARLVGGPAISFALPWPWGGETFTLRRLPRLTFIVGPLGSGKTRLARCLAAHLPDAGFLGLERLAAAALLAGDPALHGRVDRALAWLIEDGATESAALLAGLEAEGPGTLVVDMVEQGLDQATQEAVIAWLRRGHPAVLVLMTRSRSILDLSAMGAAEEIIFCPANHSPPMRVASCPGAPGYEAVASCLGSPDVRARSAGMVAWRPEAT
jgi:DNA-binding transcriptional MerR regulator